MELFALHDLNKLKGISQRIVQKFDLKLVLTAGNRCCNN